MKKLHLYSIAALVLLTVFSCAKDEALESVVVEPRNEESFNLRYDVLMSRGFVLKDAEQYEYLTNAEKTLLVPEITKASVQVSADNENVFTRVTFLPHEYDIPPSAIGTYHTPSHLKVVSIETNNGATTYYGPDNEVVGFNSELEEYENFLSAIKEMSSIRHLEDDQFAAIFEVFDQKGYEVNDYGNLQGVVFEGAQSEKTELLISKEFKAEVGYANFDAQGNILNTSYRILNDNNGSTEVKGHVFRFPLQVPESEVMLNYEMKSSLSNYSLTINE